MLMRSLYIIFVLAISKSAIADISVTDSSGTHYFDKPPTRVVALNWAITEQLVELEAPLIAISDTSGYATWVAKPALPKEVEDLGARAEPNLEKMARLKPDLIIAADLTDEQMSIVKKIAPVLNFKSFSRDHNNALAAIETFRKLATLFNKEALAEQKLNAMQLRFDQLKAQLNKAFNGKLPDVTTVRFANTASVYIYGDNSMSQYALMQLGIKPALEIKKTQWGLIQKRVLELSKIQTGAVLYFEPFPQWQQLQKSRLWQAMPVVRNQSVAPIPVTWTYGGAMSLMYLAQAMSDSLLSIAPDEVSQ